MTINSVNLNAWYNGQIDRILKSGTKRNDKISIVNQSISFDLTKGLPLLTIKPTPWKLAIKELYWFISDSFDVADLEEMGITWWRPWTDKMFANRRLNDNPFTDVEEFPYKKHHAATRRIISELQSESPNPTRLVCSLWPEEDKLGQAILPPCAGYYQVTLDSRIHITVHQRSADLMCGVPSNIIQYAFLLDYYSNLSGLPPGELRFHFGDIHIYQNHIDSPAFAELVSETRRELAHKTAAYTTAQCFSECCQSMLTFHPDKLNHLGLIGNYYHLPALSFPVVPVHTK